MLTPREKSPLPENFPRGGLNPRRCGQRTQTLPTSYSGPPNHFELSLSAFTIFVMAGCVEEVAVKKCCKYDKYGLSCFYIVFVFLICLFVVDRK